MKKTAVAEDIKIIRSKAFLYAVIILYIGTADNYTSAHIKTPRINYSSQNGEIQGEIFTACHKSGKSEI